MVLVVIKTILHTLSTKFKDPSVKEEVIPYLIKWIHSQIHVSARTLRMDISTCVLNVLSWVNETHLSSFPSSPREGRDSLSQDFLKSLFQYLEKSMTEALYPPKWYTLRLFQCVTIFNFTRSLEGHMQKKKKFLTEEGEQEVWERYLSLLFLLLHEVPFQLEQLSASRRSLAKNR